MLRAIAIICLATSLFGNQIALAQNARESDPLYLEIKRLVEDQSNCFMKHARIVARTKTDLETASYGVLARCSEEMQRYKAFSARNDLRNPAQFEAYWTTMEARDLQHVKKMIALLRTQ